MKKRIIALSLIILLICSGPLYALEDESNSGDIEALGDYADTIENGINAVAALNAAKGNDQGIASLIDGARAHLQNARIMIDGGDLTGADEQLNMAGTDVREAARMLELDGKGIKEQLTAKLVRLLYVQAVAEGLRDRLNDNGIATPNADTMLDSSMTSLDLAEDYIGQGRYVLANYELERAKSILETVQVIARESIYRYHLWNRVNDFLADAPGNIQDAEEYLLDLRTEYGLDTTVAEGLLEDYAQIIEDATEDFENALYNDCLIKIRSSLHVGRALVSEVRALLEMIEEAGA